MHKKPYRRVKVALYEKAEAAKSGHLRQRASSVLPILTALEPVLPIMYQEESFERLGHGQQSSKAFRRHFFSKQGLEIEFYGKAEITDNSFQRQSRAKALMLCRERSNVLCSATQPSDDLGLILGQKADTW